MVSPDIWLRRQLWQQLWRGPAAVSAYISIAIQLGCTALSSVVLTDLQSPSLYILLINVLICVLIILVDQTDSYRNHRLGFLRLSVAKSRSRIEALGIKSEQVDRFVDALWFNPEIEFRFRNTRFRSVELDNRGARLTEPDRRAVRSSRQKGFRSQPGTDCHCDPADRMPDLGGRGGGIG
jgi:hypothetical protein